MSKNKKQTINKKIYKQKTWPGFIVAIFSILLTLFGICIIFFTLLFGLGYIKYSMKISESTKYFNLYNNHLEQVNEEIDEFYVLNEKSINDYFDPSKQIVERFNIATVFNNAIEANNFVNGGFYLCDDSSGQEVVYSFDDVNFSDIDMARIVKDLDGEDDNNKEINVYEGGKGFSYIDNDFKIYTIKHNDINYFLYVKKENCDKKSIYVYFIENENVLIENINMVSNECIGGYIVDSEYKTVGWVGDEENKCEFDYKKLIINHFELSKTLDTEEPVVKVEVKEGKTDTSADLIVYVEEVSGMFEFSYNENKKMKFKGIKDPTKLIEENKKPLLVEFWLEENLPINGWKLITKQTVSVNEDEFYIVVFILFGFVILVVLIAMILILFIWFQFRTKKRLMKALYYDPITTGVNWLYFKNYVKKVINKKSKKDSKFCIVSLDIKKFEIQSNFLGINKTNELISNIYNFFKTKIGKTELVARHSNASFGMFLEYNELNDIEGRISELLEAFKSEYATMIFFRVGVTLITDFSMDIDDIYNLTFLIKDDSKEYLMDDINFYKEDIKEVIIWETEVETKMEKALLDQEFVVYLQPKYNTVTKKISGAEALVRWLSKERGLIPPFKFIPIFEKNGFVVKLDDYMVDKVAQIQRNLLDSGKEIFPISVNISRIHFANMNLADNIKSIVDKYNIPYDSIEIELTESAFFDDKEILFNTLLRLKEIGFLISMDDFGAGYSSLNSLKDLPIDTVKLDGEFFKETRDEEKGKIVVREAINLVKNLKMKIVAEGIETIEQVEFLENNNCDLIQGYYFDRPMPVEDYIQKTYGDK